MATGTRSRPQRSRPRPPGRAGAALHSSRASAANGLPARLQGDARAVLDAAAAFLAQFRRIYSVKIAAQCTRHHAALQLGQVLCADGDFISIDFEGEPRQPLAERQLKRSPLRDVASMRHSWHQAMFAALAASDGAQEERALEAWGRCWLAEVGAAYLDEYLLVAGAAPFVPHSAAELAVLLDTFKLERLIEDLQEDLQRRPASLRGALRGILAQLDHPAGAAVLK